jgi:uncharacterized protein YdeI (YjbR/CyaY-like superfamily)
MEEPVFFAAQAELRAWFDEHHESVKELWVGFYKKGSGKPSITWPESVDEALCAGWIDGVRKSIDETSYKIRFTPRKPSSIWSAVNVARMEELLRLGLVRPLGLQAYEKRSEKKTAIYSYEQKDAAELDEAAEREFRSNAKAWGFFESQAASYRKSAIYWVVSAKKEETRQKRLAELISDSEQGRKLKQYTWSSKK